jgi:hypothetical protein
MGFLEIFCRLLKIASPPTIQNISKPRRASIDIRRPVMVGENFPAAISVDGAFI